ncbi:MAG: hypothetical protein LBV23_10025 [Deltaproteobacteria bacterium]|jgi:hypothetical protein|nr:hypothetical protein [Deltaproteobacteria bacterium]
MIVSFIEGRIRLRLSALKGAQAPELPIGPINGIKSIQVNPMVGSVLLEYDPKVISLESIASFLEQFDPDGAKILRQPPSQILKPTTLLGRTLYSSPEAAPPKTGSAMATAEAIDLTISFVGTVLSGFFSSRRAHIQWGLATAILFLVHLWKHRRRLRPLSQMSVKEIIGLPSQQTQYDQIKDQQQALAINASELLESDLPQESSPSSCPQAPADGPALSLV